MGDEVVNVVKDQRALEPVERQSGYRAASDGHPIPSVEQPRVAGRVVREPPLPDAIVDQRVLGADGVNSSNHARAARLTCNEEPIGLGIPGFSQRRNFSNRS